MWTMRIGWRPPGDLGKHAHSSRKVVFGSNNPNPAEGDIFNIPSMLGPLSTYPASLQPVKMVDQWIISQDGNFEIKPVPAESITVNIPPPFTPKKPTLKERVRQVLLGNSPAGLVIRMATVPLLLGIMGLHHINNAEIRHREKLLLLRQMEPKAQGFKPNALSDEDVQRFRDELNAHTPHVSKRLSTEFKRVINYAKPSVVAIMENRPDTDKNGISGTGFVVREDGIIITNAHVTQGHQHNNVPVKLLDGSTYDGKILDIDQEQDLAVIQIPVGNRRLPALKFMHNTDDLIGEWVIALGHPQEEGFMASAGIIGNKEIDVFLPHRRSLYKKMLVSDASARGGNSGGPLLTMSAEVAGINSIIARSGGSTTYSIPGPMAKEYVDRVLQQHGLGQLPK